MARVLIVDDEPSVREMLGVLLQRAGYTCESAPGVRSACDSIAGSAPFDAVITDLTMPDGSGMDVLAAARTRDPRTQVLMITAYATTEQAVDAMRQGAYDYIQKPFRNAELLATLEKALEKLALVDENQALRAEREGDALGIVGRSEAMQRVRSLVERVADAPSSVLITGESGTGKEVVARALHFTGQRATASFVVVNCGALPEALMESELFGHEKGAFTGAIRNREGRFVEAHTGTLFLDEIGEIPLHVQVKLLRALQEGEIEPVGGRVKKVDIRLVCATNRDLSQEVKGGRFREDLFYRINVIPIRIPPLRDRIEDVPLLADHFLRMFASKHGKAVEGVSDAALHLMGNYGWPGNVRELENAIERAVVLCRGGMVDVDDLPPELRDPQAGHGRQITFSVGTPLAEVERRMIMETLKFTRGDKRLAADLLGIATRTIYRKIEAGLVREEQYAPAVTASESDDLLH
jgi:DNA-binding NtrC family response regulator